MKRTLTIVFVTAALAACGNKKADPPAPAAGSAAPAMAGSATAAAAGSAAPAMAGSAAPSVAAVDVPTEIDFEDQAKTEISDKNLETQLKSIESQLGN